MQLFENLGIPQLADETLESMTIKQILQKSMGAKKTQDLLDRYEYRSELDTLKASNALYSLYHELGTHEGFCIIKGGFSVLIDKMKADIPRVDILLEHEMADIKKEDSYEILVKSKKSIRAKRVIVAIPRNALAEIPCFKGLPILEQVKMRPLVRMYAVFPLENGKAWFAGMNKFICDLPIRYVLPMDPTKGTIMISYTDNRFAEEWKRVYASGGIRGVNRRLRELIQESLNITIPTPVLTRVFYWECGVGYWGVGANSHAISREMIQPFGSSVPLFVCGDNYSEKEQQWMEGALDTADNVLMRLV
jgi:hypothetical protein